MEELMRKLINAKSYDEILSYKFQVKKEYHAVFNNCKNSNIGKTQYDDIKELKDVYESIKKNSALSHDDYFIKTEKLLSEECDEKTMEILNLALLFYTMQIMNLIEKDFFKEVCLPGIAQKKCDVTLLLEPGESLFFMLWNYFEQILHVQRDIPFVLIEHKTSLVNLYVGPEIYEKLLTNTLNYYEKTNFNEIIEQILGRYRHQFTKYHFILEEQPLFVFVALGYLYTFEK